MRMWTSVAPAWRSISMSFFDADGAFAGFTGKWYRQLFAGHHAVKALLQSFWLSLTIAGLSTLVSCALLLPSYPVLHAIRRIFPD